MSYLLVLGWFACGIVSYGFLVGHLQGKYKLIAYENRIFDRIFALVALLYGPFGLFATFVVIDHYEWRL